MIIPILGNTKPPAAAGAGFPYSEDFSSTPFDFDWVKQTTTGTDKSGDIGSSGGSLTYSATGAYVALAKDLGGMPTQIRVDFKAHTDANFQIGMVYGASWDADPDYAGGMISRFYYGQNRLYCGVMSTAGEPTIVNTSGQYTVTDEANYYLIFTPVDHGDGTSDMDVALYDSTDTLRLSQAQTATSNTGFTTEFALLLYNFTGANIEILSVTAVNT